jgi:hypothetical protein
VNEENSRKSKNSLPNFCVELVRYFCHTCPLLAKSGHSID